MNRRCLLAMAMLYSGTAHAATDPPDPHIVRAPYSQDHALQIVAQKNHVLTLTFGVDERVQRIVTGDDSVFQTAGNERGQSGKMPVRNNVPIWPEKPGSETNIQVTTLLPDGTERLYNIYLRVLMSTTDDDPSAVYNVIYTYPLDEAKKAAAVAAARRVVDSTKKAEERLKVDVFYGNRNRRYFAWGKHSVAPTEVSDNQRTTAFRFPGNMRTPAIYVITPDGNEQWVVPTTVDDNVVVPMVAAKWILRAGKDVVAIYNDCFYHPDKCPGYDLHGLNPGTGTTSPDVIREIKATPAPAPPLGTNHVAAEDDYPPAGTLTASHSPETRIIPSLRTK